jgi:sugar lactone lactonase YvrE/uncharacterized coiled-coil protein SlyX
MAFCRQWRNRACLGFAGVILATQVSACQSASQTTSAVVARPDTSTKAPPVVSKLVTLKGAVNIPVGILLGKGVGFARGGLIGNSSGSLISNNGGALKPGAVISSFQLQQAVTTRLRTAPVSGAKIYLADAAGQPIPGLPVVQTDDAGTFNFPQIPHGFTYLVIAQVETANGKLAEFRTVVGVGPLGSTTVVNPSSPLVAASVLDGLTKPVLGDFNPAKLQLAMEAIDARLTESNLPDFTSPLAIKAGIDRLSEEIAELRSALAEVRQELAQVRQKLEEMQQSLQTPQPLFSPQPVPAVETASPRETSLPGGGTSGLAVPGAVANTLVVSTFTGSIQGNVDGRTDAALFNSPQALAFDGANTLYISDTGNNRIRKITPTGDIVTLAGTVSGVEDGSAQTAKFNRPLGLSVDGEGNVYVADSGNHRIRKIAPSGYTSTFAGLAAGLASGALGTARFRSLAGLTFDQSGRLWIADTANHRIRLVSQKNQVLTLAGMTAGFANGTGDDGRFNKPWSLAMDGAGNVVVADAGNHCIRKVTPDGQVTTLAGSTAGYQDGPGAVARFNNPTAVVVDAAQNIFVADSNNHCIRRVTSSGEVSTLAGGSEGELDGPASRAQFRNPAGLAIDSTGALYVADTSNNRIRVIRNSVAGSGVGSANGTGTGAQFDDYEEQ